MNKKAISFVLAAALCFGITACKDSTGGSENSDTDKTSETVLDGKEFETNERFISIADVPPVNFDKLDDYVALGFSGYILTEDGVKLTNNGAMTEVYKNAAAAVKKAGLDVYIRNQYNDPDYFQNDDGDTLRNKFVAGYSYKIPVRNLTTEFKDLGISGFYMADEPVYDNLYEYGKLIDWYNEYYSDTYFHMNLFPSYAKAENFSRHSFVDYVRAYVDEIASKVKGKKSICVDNYPFQTTESIRSSYFGDLIITATATKKYNATAAEKDKANFGLCIQTFFDGGLTDIRSKADVSFQICTGIAMGAKVYEYFCYGSGQGMYGIMTSAGEKRVYDYVKDGNAYLAFEKVVNSFEWQGVNAVAAENEKNRENADSFDTLAEFALRDTGKLDVSKTKSRLDSLIGTYKKGDRDGYMVVNCSLPSSGKDLEGRSGTVDLSIKNSRQALVYRIKEGVLVSSVEKIVDGTLRINLGAGDGAFVIPA